MNNIKDKIIKYGLIVLLLLIVIFIFMFVYNMLNVKYNVNFYVEDNIIIETKKVKNGNVVLEPASPQKEGYKFIGWYDNTEKFDFKTKIKKDINLYAKFEIIEGYVFSYVVSFDSNYGSTVPYQTVESGSVAKIPSEPTKNNYNFIEWRLNGIKYNFDTPVIKDITLIAYWELALNEDEKNLIKAKQEIQDITIEVNNPKLISTLINGKCKVTWDSSQFNSIIRESYDVSDTVVANITCGTAISTKQVIATIKKSPYTYTIKDEKYFYVYNNNTIVGNYKLYDINNKSVGTTRNCSAGSCITYSGDKIISGNTYYIVFNNNTNIKYSVTLK